MKRIQQLIQKIFDNNKIAGLTVAITDKQKILATFNYGLADACEKTIIEDTSLFRIASISKIVTGLCVMRLVDDGKLDLNAPIGSYVEWLETPFAELTLNSLLSHTAGLPKEYTPDGTRDESLLEKSLIDELAKVDLLKVGNGKAHLYSNVGIRLASLIVQKVVGEPFSKVAKRLVLEPLQMKDTTYYLQSALKGNLTKPHQIDEGQFKTVPHWENAVRYGAGGLISTASDVCKLARVLLNLGVTDSGERLISERLVRDMIDPVCPSSKGDYYGKTIMLHSYNDRLLSGHLGSAPPYYANVVADYKSGYGVVVLYNTEDNGKLRYEITDSVLGCLTK
jgi:CubicO group peptidase (beta-lactamase class C family)